MSGECWVGQGDGIQEPIAGLSHDTRPMDFYIAVGDMIMVDDEIVAVPGDGTAILGQPGQRTL